VKAQNISAPAGGAAKFAPPLQFFYFLIFNPPCVCVIAGQGILLQNDLNLLKNARPPEICMSLNQAKKWKNLL
jgi:hypothetical protein